MASADVDVLSLMDLTPADISVDYVNNKTQFHLHSLVTEQRHKKTFNLSQDAKADTAKALASLFSVDEDITAKFRAISNDASLMDAVQAIKRAMKAGRKIYYYGCGATGRLSKQMESSFWRPFWEKVEKKHPDRFTAMQDLVIGEMTGADKALISSLEGLEDLQIVGKLQLEDHGVRKGDVVFCITEGGETSSVIGTMLAARAQYADKDVHISKKNLFFIFNNPEHCLSHLERSRAVLDSEGITKIPLWTGNQSVTGSTRMQATTSEQFLAGIIMEQAIYEYLTEQGMSDKDLIDLGFAKGNLADRLLSFDHVQKSAANANQEVSKMTDMETQTYKSGGRSVYWSDAAMVTVFTDSTERSPTFRLHPLDQMGQDRKCWIKVVTSAKKQKEAWNYFLKRPFKGMEKRVFLKPFQTAIEDPYLREAALRSLDQAGNDQEIKYDFSCQDLDPRPKDMAVVSLLNEDKFTKQHKSFLDTFSKLKDGKSAFILTTPNRNDKRLMEASVLSQAVIPLISPAFALDALEVRQHMAIKMTLNAHSTCTMAKMGRLVGNTMTNVSPSNLKLIGRATALILMHVNDKLKIINKELSYKQANAVLYDVIRYVTEIGKEGDLAELALSIVRILEVVKAGKNVDWTQAEKILDFNQSLENYLDQFKI